MYRPLLRGKSSVTFGTSTDALASTIGHESEIFNVSALDSRQNRITPAPDVTGPQLHY